MRIQNNSVNKILNIYNNASKVDQTKKTGKEKKSDQLNISNRAREFQVAMEQIKNQPDIRAEKVAAIKKQVESGTYKVDAQKIADKMMQDANIYTRL